MERISAMMNNMAWVPVTGYDGVKRIRDQTTEMRKSFSECLHHACAIENAKARKMEEDT